MADLHFTYEPDPDLLVSLPEKLGRFPRQSSLLWDGLRRAASDLGVLALRAQFPLTVKGALPDAPRVALAANHQSHLDTLAVLAALSPEDRRDLAVIAAQDYFFTRLDRALAASLVGQAVAFDRTTRAALAEWQERLARMARGRLLVFPSGSRKQAIPRSGFLRVLHAAGWQIVPVAIRGTDAAWPVGAHLWRPFRPLRVCFGDPLAVADPHDLVPTLTSFWEAHP